MMSAWISRWKVPEHITLVSSQADYRDTLPTRPEEVAEQLASVVQVTHLLSTSRGAKGRDRAHSKALTLIFVSLPTGRALDAGSCRVLGKQGAADQGSRCTLHKNIYN